MAAGAAVIGSASVLVGRSSLMRDQDRRQIDGSALRQRLAGVAASIACTEDQAAETMERMATVLPYDAARLRAGPDLCRLGVSGG
jgi:hypothetical protein